MRFKAFLSIGIIFLLSSVLALAALDLQFNTAISQSPDPASAGNVVTFTVSFKTTGGAVTNFKIIGGVDGTQLFDRTYASILADKVKTDTFTWTATAGSHTVWFELDPTHSCGDSNYGNNRIERAITVSGGGPAGQPDLTPVVTYSPTKFSTGDAVAFSFRVNNNGTAASTACDMILKQDGPMWAPFTVPVIAAGGHWETSYTWYAKCDAALEIEVDTNDQNTESNEGNNTWSKMMNCGLKISRTAAFNTLQSVYKADPNGPDLTVKILPLPKNFTDGQYGALSFEVENKGAVKSAPCKLVVKKGVVVAMIIDLPAIEKGTIYPISYMEMLNCGAKLSIQVDSDNKNIESNEENNVAVKKIVCLSLK